MHQPLATYRVQLNKHFQLRDALNLLPHLQKLGISDVYLSPILTANPGSMHGYDVTDYTQINPEIGGMEDFIAFCETAKSKGISVIVDIVPNHMAATEHNPFWVETLKLRQDKNGLFDINWEESNPEKIVYRRFFDINELVCLHAENEKIFLKTHQIYFELIKRGLIQGLRIDHIDGLRNPTEYLNRLTAQVGEHIYVIVEKILGFQEQLLPQWPIAGTTGYDFMNHSNQWFIYPTGLEYIRTHYEQQILMDKTIEHVLADKKEQVIDLLFPQEFKRLVAKLATITEQTKESVERVLRSFAKRFPIYRTYFAKGYKDPQGQQLVEKLLQSMAQDGYEISHKIHALLTATKPLTPDEASWLSDWQTFTGPLMAKSFEDTFCYNYYPLVALNEVGSSLEFFYKAGDTEHLHRYQQLKNTTRPFALNATSTHDSKRSEDARSRLNVLSECASEWVALVSGWITRYSIGKSQINQQPAPDAVDEWILYQSLLSIWPVDQPAQVLQDRIQNFLLKAMRERKVQTNWYQPDESYEQAVHHFVQKLFHDKSFLQEMTEFIDKVAFYGVYNSISQLVLKITSPGIPDFYQGTEHWTFTLVDPDNRNAIDYTQFTAALTNPELNLTFSEGNLQQLKTNCCAKLLHLRKKYQELLTGHYEAVPCIGPLHEHAIAYTCGNAQRKILVLTLRWFTKLLQPHEDWHAQLWGNESLLLPFDQVKIYDLMTDNSWEQKEATLKIAPLLANHPFAILLLEK